MATSQDHEKNLETLALFVWGDVRSAMMASYVMFVAEAWFYQYPEDEQRKLFRTNPANTLTYTSLSALFQSSVVHVAEVLKDENGLHPVNVEVRRKADLALHRHSISHPVTVKWDRQKMQDFADADRAVYEYLPAQVWDANRSINEGLSKANRPVHNETIEATLEMAALLRTILEMSMNVDDAEAPSREALFTYLQINAAKYQAQLEKSPDGGRDPKKEKERAAEKRATWEARRREWSKTAQTLPEVMSVSVRGAV